MDLNNSQLQAILMCGVRWEFQYAKKMYAPASFEMARGTILHKVRQENFKQKKQTGSDMTEEQAHCEGMKAITDIEFRPHEERLDMKKTISNGIEVDARKNWATIVPLFVEETIQVHPKGWDFKIFGTLDLLTQDGRLIDLKTVSRRKSPEAAHNSTQMSLYTILPRQFGFKVRQQEFQYLIFNRYSVSAETIRTHREPSDLEACLTKIQRAVSLIEKGIFMPAPDGAWYCHPKWCAYYQICPFVTTAAKNFALGGSHVTSNPPAGDAGSDRQGGAQD